MTEKPLLFGRRKSLVGILTEPPPGMRKDRPGVLILNAGVLHRVGPNRLHVQFARALAEAGFPVLRFDLSGIGDSRPRAGDTPFAAGVLEDISDGVDLLASKHGVERCLIVGICSGADNGLEAAIRDPRIAGLALIDGYNLPSLRFTLYEYRGRLFNVLSWVRLLAGRSDVWKDLWGHARAAARERPKASQLESLLPAPAEYVRHIRALADRGVHLLLVYSGISPSFVNYDRLLRTKVVSWPSRDRISVEHFRHSDHTFTLLEDQRKLVRRVCDWATCLALPPGLAGASPERPR